MEDMHDAESAWNKKREELEQKLMVAANELMEHCGACRMTMRVQEMGIYDGAGITVIVEPPQQQGILQ